ncbi:MAG: hypothetical protein J6U54_20270 [Clostridiales bacterium]|nr:hypothetical protein [Clostridiales bacterium]
MGDTEKKSLLEFDEMDAIQTLESMIWPAQRGDTLSYTHMVMNMSLHMAINALREKWLAKHRLKED